METGLDRALRVIRDEVNSAQKQHPPFPTVHHAYAVILEELDEVKREAFKKHYEHEQLRLELIQTAAMCVRALLDLSLIA